MMSFFEMLLLQEKYSIIYLLQRRVMNWGEEAHAELVRCGVIVCDLSVLRAARSGGSAFVGRGNHRVGIRSKSNAGAK